MEMRRATICYPLRHSQILLGMKKERFGAGKWNGFGGKMHRHETASAAAARELREESHLIASPGDLKHVARIKFFEGDEPLFECEVFFVERWTGTERETKEMRPQWFDVENIPYDTMWAADRQWLSILLEGLKIDAAVRFKPGMEEVESFEYDELAA